ncbi:Protein DMR6-LIKE OXYGENASE 2 [Camellia lanceoleosa]|uniref:Protein DMR6-LIKE OXYGENASE 2 n=1 Tax=Camellia lanceoleosa TaxID=1840588 RepID=A0ACC0GNA9_9ERIC|nr:Protein DMR6-LIKE OXYGENASE 2 [Camellia lanceoleosa]
MYSVKALVDSGFHQSAIPSKFIASSSQEDDTVLSQEEAIPTIDFSLLTSGDPDQRSKVIQDIGNACRDWGFFMVINHGVQEMLMDDMVKASKSFFDMSEKEKGEYHGKQLFDPIRSGTSFNVLVDKSSFWRDYLKVHVHPHFNSPNKPTCFREISQEYCKRAREVASELLKGMSMSLGLEENYIDKAMEVEFGSQLLVVNFYPPCPQPELAIGMPPHSDHGLLTLLIQNQLGGLQVLHNDKWVPINPLPNSILVNTGDHMEILTNGKYKSVVHRAMVNNKANRISIATSHGPPLDKVVSPAQELVDTDFHPIAYHGITYREYLELQQSNELNGKSCLDRIRV